MFRNALTPSIRRLRVLVAGAFVPALVMGVPPGAEAASTDTAAVSCYGGAVDWYEAAWGTRAIKTVGPFTTSARCNDINIRQDSSGKIATACVRFRSATAPCNRQTVVGDRTSWLTIATDVLDGTRFYVTLANGNGGSPVYGKFAY